MKSPLIKAIAGYAWAAVFFSGLFWMVFWKDIRNSDLYQRNFNTARWEEKQREHATRMDRYKELDQIECRVMLRAKAALIPIEIERSVLLGMEHDHAGKIVMDEFELNKKLCEKHGISPSAASSKSDTRDECERYPGIYGC